MKIFSVDAESDGLYGYIWAIGAVVWQDGEIVDRFEGMAQTGKVQDVWVRENILPVVNLRDFHTRYELRAAFWRFWLKHREDAICLSDFGSPVEAYLFRMCIDDNIRERLWQGPYPMHELGTALLLAGVDTYRRLHE